MLLLLLLQLTYISETRSGTRAGSAALLAGV